MNDWRSDYFLLRIVKCKHDRRPPSIPHVLMVTSLIHPNICSPCLLILSLDPSDPQRICVRSCFTPSRRRREGGSRPDQIGGLSQPENPGKSSTLQYWLVECPSSKSEPTKKKSGVPWVSSTPPPVPLYGRI